MKTALLLLGLAAIVAADCPNACSGHGDCNTNWDFCECYHGFIGADCSQRLCQFGLSWIDTPQGDLNHDNDLNDGFGDSSATGSARPAGTPDSSALNPMWRFQGWWERHPAALYGTNDQNFDLPFYVRAQEGHFYAECSNRGICNRATGLCDCLTGYEGAACNRTVCQNDCSGHGICQTVREVTPDHLHYRLWDMDKTRICECDGGYFGMDCSQRACMKNDDPLTVTTTREDYNDGLTEQNEEQIVEVRCPFNGDMLDPSISLTYTDVQFGDAYETARFDPTDVSTGNADAIVAALKALPNQVLADYAVDGVTIVEKVVGATGMLLETDNFYRWTITFHEHLGDVPLLQGTAYFKCRGGAEVSTRSDDGTYVVENIDVAFLGDGPDMFLEIDGTIADNAGAADTWDYEVFNAEGTSLGATPGTTDTYTIADFTDPATADHTYFAAGNAFTRELAKVGLGFGLDNDGAGARDRLNIKIHVTPVITVRNSQYVLSAAADRLNAGGAAIPARAAGIGTLAVDVEESVTPRYDQHHLLSVIDSTATGDILTVRWMVNGEFYSIVDIDTSGGGADGTAAFAGKINTMTATGFHTYTAFGITTVDDVSISVGAVATDGDYVGDSFEWYSRKTSVMSQAVPAGSDGAPIDYLEVFYADFVAPSMAIPLVIQIVETHDNPDKYSWKVAGDTAWVTPQDSNDPGFPVPADLDDVGTKLGELEWYLTTRYPDDPMRQGLASVRINFDDDAGAMRGGPENDQRICTTQSGGRQSKYYVQIGSQGLNDSPECSDRGICDYGSGTCRCYRGYAGIDCSEQNALSAGYSSSTSAF